MSVEFNHLRSTKAILDAVKAALAALTIPIGSETPKAFGTVEIFDMKDWEAAIQTLVTTENRICLVLYAGDSYERVASGITMLNVRRTTKIELLIADYHVSDGVKAQLGDGAQPGSVGLLDAVLGELTGVVLDQEVGKDAVYLMPAGVEQMTITEADKQDAPGRNLISVSFDAIGQWMSVGVRSSTLGA